MEIEIPVEVSARHIHLNEEDTKILFGNNYQLKWRNDISQHGQYACEETVEICSLDGQRKLNARVLGPLRDESYAELSITDLFYMKINAPLAVEFEANGKKIDEVMLKGPKGEIEGAAVIIKKRHIHCDIDMAKKYGFENDDMVSVLIKGERAITFHNVIIRVDKSYAFRFHLDTDEANAAKVKQGSIGYITKG